MRTKRFDKAPMSEVHLGTILLFISCIMFVLMNVSGKPNKVAPPAPDLTVITDGMIVSPPVDGPPEEKLHLIRSTPQTTEAQVEPIVEIDIYDPEGIVHTRELLKNTKPGPGVQWRVVMPVPLEETQPDLRRRRRKTDRGNGRDGLARDDRTGHVNQLGQDRSERSLPVDSREVTDGGFLMDHETFGIEDGALRRVRRRGRWSYRRRNRRRRKYGRRGKRNAAFINGFVSSAERHNGNSDVVKDNQETGKNNGDGVLQRVRRRSRRRRKHHRLGKRDTFPGELVSPDTDDTHTDNNVDRKKFNAILRRDGELVSSSVNPRDDSLINTDKGNRQGSFLRAWSEKSEYKAAREGRGRAEVERPKPRANGNDVKENDMEKNVNSHSRDSPNVFENFKILDGQQTQAVRNDDAVMALSHGDDISNLDAKTGTVFLVRKEREVVNPAGDNIGSPGNSLIEDSDDGDNDDVEEKVSGGNSAIADLVTEDDGDDEENGEDRGVSSDESAALAELKSDDEEITDLHTISLASNVGLNHLKNRLDNIHRHPVKPPPGTKESVLMQKLRISKSQLEKSIADMKRTEEMPSRDQLPKTLYSSSEEKSKWEISRAKEDAWYRDQLNRIRKEKNLLQRYGPEMGLEDGEDAAPPVKKLPVGEEDDILVGGVHSGESGEEGSDISDEDAVDVNIKLGANPQASADSIEGDDGDDEDDGELAETMQRLEKKVDDVQSMIRSPGLPWRSHHVRKRESEGLPRYTRYFTSNPSLGLSSSAKGGGTAVPGSTQKTNSPDDKRGVDTTLTFGGINYRSNIKGSALPVSQLRSAEADGRPGYLPDTSGRLSKNCDKCGQEKEVNRRKDVSTKAPPRSLSLGMPRYKRSAKGKEREIVYITLSQKGKEESLPAKEVFSIKDSSTGNESIINEEKSEGKVNISELLSDIKHALQGEVANNETDQNSSTGNVLFQKSSTSQIDIKVPQEKMVLKSLLPRQPDDPFIKTYPSDLEYEALAERLPARAQVSSWPLKRNGQIENKKNIFAGILGFDAINNAQTLIRENLELEEKKALSQLKQAEFFQDDNLHRMVHALTTQTIRGLKNVLQGLRTIRNSADGPLDTGDMFAKINSFIESGRFDGLFDRPSGYKATSKNSVLHRLLGERSPLIKMKEWLLKTADAHNIPTKSRQSSVEPLAQFINSGLKTYVLPRAFPRATMNPLQTLLDYVLVKPIRELKLKNHDLHGDSLHSPIRGKAKDSRFGFGMKAPNGLHKLAQALERLTKKADMIEQRIGLADRDNFDDGLIKRYLGHTEHVAIPEENMLRTFEALDPTIHSSSGSSISETSSMYPLDLIRGKDDTQLHLLERLTKDLIRALCRITHHRSRRRRDVSRNHMVNENKKDDNIKARGIKSDKEPHVDEVHRLENKLQRVLAKFPVPNPENIARDDLKRMDSQIAAASDVLRAIIASAKGKTDEHLVADTSRSRDMLPHGARKRRRVTTKTGKKRTGRLSPRGRNPPRLHGVHQPSKAEKRPKVSPQNRKLRAKKGKENEPQLVKTRQSNTRKEISNELLKKKELGPTVPPTVKSAEAKSSNASLFKSWLYAYHPSHLLKRDAGQQQQQQEQLQQREQQQKQEDNDMDENDSIDDDDIFDDDDEDDEDYELEVSVPDGDDDIGDYDDEEDAEDSENDTAVVRGIEVEDIEDESEPVEKNLTYVAEKKETEEKVK